MDVERARESARQSDGRFGRQDRKGAEVSLGAGNRPLRPFVVLTPDDEVLFHGAPPFTTVEEYVKTESGEWVSTTGEHPQEVSEGVVWEASQGGGKLMLPNHLLYGDSVGYVQKSDVDVPLAKGEALAGLRGRVRQVSSALSDGSFAGVIDDGSLQASVEGDYLVVADRHQRRSFHVPELRFFDRDGQTVVKHPNYELAYERV